ncbi:hypothetical protein [Clostridium estertheticum]|uniref:hypothetical protein n=1 Tax=Clostridium estertheticum TaxID=238834 RepID=UPI001CF20996|nr:hypothetical protein [Clostridium estertheticum]MCB2339559.1 hypothetical protein [Clostridium estertheticum]
MINKKNFMRFSKIAMAVVIASSFSTVAFAHDGDIYKLNDLSKPAFTQKDTANFKNQKQIGLYSSTYGYESSGRIYKFDDLTEVYTKYLQNFTKTIIALPSEKIAAGSVGQATTITVSSVSAADGKVTVTLKGAPTFAPKDEDFVLTQTIGDGVTTVVASTGFSIDSETNSSFTIPAVTTTSSDQSVIYGVSYKNQAVVNSTPVIIKGETDSSVPLTTTVNLYDATAYFKGMDYTQLVYVRQQSEFNYSIILEDGKILIGIDSSDPQNGDVTEDSKVVVGVVKGKALVSTVDINLKSIETGKTKVVDKASPMDKYLDFISNVSELYTNDNLVYEFNVPIAVDEEEDATIQNQVIKSEQQVLASLTLNGVKPKSIKKVNLFNEDFNQYQVIMPEKVLKDQIIVNVDGMYMKNTTTNIKSLNFVRNSFPRDINSSFIEMKKEIKRDTVGLVATTLTTDLTNDFSNVDYDTLKIVDQKKDSEDTDSCTVALAGNSLIITPVDVNAESIAYYNELTVVALKDGLPVKYGRYECINIYYKNGVK